MLLRSLRLKRLLSFRDTEIELGPLNVLIGPNASGKSNLIAAIGLLQAAPTDLSAPIVRGGGAREWTYKGDAEASPFATLAAEMNCEPSADAPLSYEITIADDGGGLLVQQERLSCPPRDLVFFSRSAGRVGTFNSSTPPATASSVPSSKSFFSEYKNPQDPTPITRMGRQLAGIGIFTEFQTGPWSQSRTGIATTGTPKEHLQDGGHNLAFVLSHLSFLGKMGRINELLSRFCEGFEEVRTSIDAGVIRAHILEQGLAAPTPATRLSDGTLKFLCLLTVLLDPAPPALICIEEPELGLHPDALPLVAEALVEASERTQVVVTTHSESLVGAFSGKPEAVLVCEREFDSGTQFQRLSSEKLAGWLERYSLGELWRKGEIGGNRW